MFKNLPDKWNKWWGSFTALGQGVIIGLGAALVVLVAFLL